jgi:3-dehydroquinate synthase
MSPELVFSKRFPQRNRFPVSTLLIFDLHLLRRSNAVKKFIESFPLRYGVVAGEKLKSLRDFSGHVNRMMTLAADLPRSQATVLVLGGGSVGDFGAFFASVFKRGVQLEMIPSTWLSAIDSAHGGKTALNVGQRKNVIGTFYPARRIYLVEQILKLQPPERLADAAGEAIKISLLNLKLYRSGNCFATAKALWKALPSLILAKYQVVRRDPWDELGLRAILNLGHTLGHALETLCRLSHGKAVFWGMLFALEWSRQRHTLSDSKFQEIMKVFFSPWIEHMGHQPRLPSYKKSLQFLIADKKALLSDEVAFVFLKSPGQARLESVTWKDFLAEAVRQGFLRG